MYIYIFFFLTIKQNSTKETSNIYIHSQIKWSDKCPNFCENLPALKQTEAAIKLSIRDRISHFVHHKFDENWHFSAPIVFAARYINHDNAVLYRAIWVRGENQVKRLIIVSRKKNDLGKMKQRV